MAVKNVWPQYMLDIRCPAATDNRYKKSGRKRSGILNIRSKIFRKEEENIWIHNVIIKMNSYLQKVFVNDVKYVVNVDVYF